MPLLFAAEEKSDLFFRHLILSLIHIYLGTGLIVYNSQNTIQIGDTVSLNTNGQSKEIQIVGMLSDCPFYSAAGVGTIICSRCV